jgi:catechol 2,3-dioxygenase-like lactoylglutathione lyase family enzyme
MNRLLYVITFTSAMERMKSFYRESMGFEVVADSPYWVSFGTGGASLALMAIHPNQKREFELCMESADIEADVRTLKSRGVPFIDEVKSEAFGRVTHSRDPEGNLLSLLQPPSPAPASRGPALNTIVLNCRDVAAMRVWYREKLGLPVLVDSPWWVEFDAGETHVALHPLVDHAVLETHHAEPVTLGFSSSDLDGWVEELKVRGIEFSEDITDRGFGRFAEAEDPDGNMLVLRDSPPPTLEEKLAEEYETGDEPHQEAIRRAVTKNSKAVSRLAVKPEYHETKKSGARPEAEPARAITNGAEARQNLRRTKAAGVAISRSGVRAGAQRSAPSVRGEGRDHARLKPLHSSDPERARLKPAVGHQKKATKRALERQREEVAAVSRMKPMKRASSAAKPAKRAVARVAVAKKTVRAAAKKKSSRTPAKAGKRR